MVPQDRVAGGGGILNVKKREMYSILNFKCPKKFCFLLKTNKVNQLNFTKYFAKLSNVFQKHTQPLNSESTEIFLKSNLF